MTVYSRYYAPEVVQEARDWIAECVSNPEDVEDASDDECIQWVCRNYCGGWGAFFADMFPEDVR